MKYNILQQFLNKRSIEDCLVTYPDDMGLKELFVKDITYLYGNNGLIAFTATTTYEWVCNDYGQGYVFELIDEYSVIEGCNE